MVEVAWEAIKIVFIIALLIAVTTALVLFASTMGSMGRTGFTHIISAQRADIDGDGTVHAIMPRIMEKFFLNYAGVWTTLVGTVGLLSTLYVAFWVYRLVRTVLL